MNISVVLATYRRVERLGFCLKALQNQKRSADENLIIIRNNDLETQDFVESIKLKWTNIKSITVAVPGQVAALNIGLKEAKGDIIVFTDDDAVPHSDWLEKIEQCFKSDLQIGGVGGREWLCRNGLNIKGSVCKVGVITWYGRIVGNHHLGAGEPREVDHLKGSNMSFRRKAIKNIYFDKHLRGRGAQYRNDLALSLAVKRRGWKLIYDPKVAIDHYYAKRFEEDQRGDFNLTAIEDAAYNEMLIFLKYMHVLQKIACIIYAILVGNIFTPGICQWLRIALTGQKNSWLRFSAAQKGRWQALKNKKSK